MTDQERAPERAGRWALATLVTAALAAGLAFGSLAPLPVADPEHGVLLLDWRLRGEEAGPCLQPTEEELERLPSHMQNPDACLGALPPYRLTVRVDGEPVVDEPVRGGGGREDRPLTVYRRLALPPGSRAVEVAFVREDGEAGALELRLRDTVEAERGRVLLLVRRADTGELEIREPVRR